MDELRPRVRKREKKVHLSYELADRIYCSRIYPVAAPNGSTIIFYGHDRGLRVLWRGGRRPKDPSTSRPAPRQPNGIGKSQDVIVLDDSDDEPRQAEPEPMQPEHEDEEEEQDPDCPYAPLVQDVDIDLGASVLQMATPSTASFGRPRTPTLTTTDAILGLACTDGKVLLISVPLTPPSAASKRDFVGQAVNALELEGDGTTVHDLTIKVISIDDEQMTSERSRSASSDGQLLVAAVATRLSIWSVNLRPNSMSNSQESLLPIMHSPLSGSAVHFESSSRSNRLLLANRSAVYVYDVSAGKATDRRIRSQDSSPHIPTSGEEIRHCIMSFHAPFQQPKDRPSLARRKKILDAAWVLGGRGILVLLEDGQWGIWDLSGSIQAGKSVEDFTLRGYVGASATTETADSHKERKGASKLAPMTPNTRKAKAENLFSGAAKPPGVAATGGISLSTSIDNRSGSVDESVLLWYNNDLYAIASMQTFWQRSSNNGGGFGSLYAPGLAHVSDIDLMNENITSVSQFASKSSASGLGQMNTQRDLLISAEHRLIISQSRGPPAAKQTLFQQPASRPTSRDQRMLDVGELDLDGMDRMLDSIAGEGRTRRVGFAH